MLSLGLVFALNPTARAGNPGIIIRNNHDQPYSGPIAFRAEIPDGSYGAADARAEALGGMVRAVVNLPARSQVRLTPDEKHVPLSAGPLALKAEQGILSVEWDGKQAATIDLGLVVVPGRTAETAQVPMLFQSLKLGFAERADGAFSAATESHGYLVEVLARPYGGGWIDFEAKVTNLRETSQSAYVSFVRRITTPDAASHRMRWNGRLVDSAEPPSDFNIDFRLTRGMDWLSWKSGDLTFAAVNGFTPGITVERSRKTWAAANRFYVWEYAKTQGNDHYLISEIAGRDPEQKKDYEGIKSYTQPRKGEPVRLKWRLAVGRSRDGGWEESQLRVFAGYRNVSRSNGDVTVDLGVPYVEFGTSYFPYSTMCENFDYYRTPGLDREGWWPFSPEMWENWRAFAPQMRTDLRIIRSMGFDWVRLHHLELIGSMDRKNALDFLDFYMGECRTLGLKVLVDTAGTPAWFATVAGRYRDVVKLIEIENEILIPGIKPDAPERWTSCYRAAKEAAPDAEVFLTGNCNMGMFERLVRLGVPFDRVGYHSYKHGPGWEETFRTLPLAVAGCAAELGTTPVLGEFNWKELTRWSPEARADRFETIYRNVLSERAVREFFQFHWQETLSVNPSITRQGIRHYETIYLDRRPKPEAQVFMKLIRQYCRPDAPVRELPIIVEETTLVGGRASAGFSIENKTDDRVTIKLSLECFGEIECKLKGENSLTLEPGGRAKGTVDLSLKQGARPGAYHFFVRADYGAKTSYGWGITANPGPPQFDPEPVLKDLVGYAQGASSVAGFDWSKPICVAFGAESPVVELEMAYMVFNTLQSATGRKMRLCSTADIPADLAQNGNLVLIGTPKSNALIGKMTPDVQAGKGLIDVREVGGGRHWLLLTGDDGRAVQAAATDFVLRYWKNAKDSSTRITGLERGAALGDRAATGQLNPP